MFSEFVLNYIKPLNEENINTLQIPHLLMDDPIETISQIKLNISKKKIMNFNYNEVNPTMSILNSEIINKQLCQRLNIEYGEWRFTGNDNNEVIKKSIRKEYNIIALHNCRFIDINRNKIIERIDEIYNTNAIKIKEELDKKKKEYANEKIKCECGYLTYRKNLTRHKKSKQHLNCIEIITVLKEEIKIKQKKEPKQKIPVELVIVDEIIKDKIIEVEVEVEDKIEDEVEVEVEDEVEDEIEDEVENKNITIDERIKDYFEEEKDNIIEYDGTTNITKRFKMDYNGKTYLYIEWLRGTKPMRDWLLNNVEQEPEISMKLDTYAKSLGVKVAYISTMFW